MAKSVFLYPSLTNEMRERVFQARSYMFSYTNREGLEKELEYEAAGASSYFLKTDGVWGADNYNLYVKRSLALRKYKDLFGPNGLACSDARLGLSVVWTSPDSRQRDAKPVLEFGLSPEELAESGDHTFEEGEVELEFPRAKVRGELRLSIVLYIAKAGTPSADEIHLANEEGFVLGEFDAFTIRLDGTGSLFPVYEVFDKERPLWYVRCDWTDPLLDSFSDNVSINMNTAHRNFKLIDRTQRSFCPQLLVEVMSAALCCIIEKLRSEKYLDQILGDEELEKGSVGEVVRYFANTLGWDMSSPDNLSVSTRKFFDRRLSE